MIIINTFNGHLNVHHVFPQIKTGSQLKVGPLIMAGGVVNTNK